MYKKAIGIDEKHIESIINYGNLLQNVRMNYDKAEEMYCKALEIDKTNIDA